MPKRSVKKTTAPTPKKAPTEDDNGRTINLKTPEHEVFTTPDSTPIATGQWRIKHFQLDGANAYNLELLDHTDNILCQIPYSPDRIGGVNYMGQINLNLNNYQVARRMAHSIRPGALVQKRFWKGKAFDNTHRALAFLFDQLGHFFASQIKP